MTAQAEANKAIVRQLWEAMAVRDWDRFKSFFTEDAHYTDRGLPGPGATGPDAIIRRLHGLAILADYCHLPDDNMIAEGDLVMTEHIERWVFEPGNVLDHPFVSVTELRDGKVCRWHDYSHIGNVMGNAPAWWIQEITKAAQA
jgi:ketosteroid isomerase-like protein